MAQKEILIGKYRVLRRLGKGGMGEVFLGRDNKLNRLVAIKVMSKKLSSDENFVARFRREAQAAAAISHANVTQIHEFDELNGIYFFVMEYVEGGTLEDLLQKQGSLRPERALDIMIQAARGLRAAAAINVIHRDVKPSNIMVGRDGTVKLADFGLAKALEDSSQLTKTDVILGTPHYVSPEQARGEKNIDFRSDIYSLGVTFYQVLSGKLPFDAATSMGVMLRHVNDPPPPLLQICPALPEQLVTLVHRMLEKRPDDRFQSYDELIAEIERIRPSVIGIEQSGADPVKSSAPTIQTPAGKSPAETAASAQTLISKKGDINTTTPASFLKFPPFGGYSDAAWALFIHPSSAWSELALTPLSWAAPLKLGGWLFLIAFIGSGVIMGSAKAEPVQHGLFLLLVIQSVLFIPFLSLVIPKDFKNARIKSAFNLVLLCWLPQAFLILPPFRFIILAYPVMLFRGLQNFLRLKGLRLAFALCSCLLAWFVIFVLIKHGLSKAP